MCIYNIVIFFHTFIAFLQKPSILAFKVPYKSSRPDIKIAAIVKMASIKKQQIKYFIFWWSDFWQGIGSDEEIKIRKRIKMNKHKK